MVQHAFPHELSAAVVKAAKTASRLGLFAANQGNLSVRDRTTGLIGITPHDYPYDDLTVDDLVVVAPNGTQVIGRLEPSYDVRVHRTVYELRAGHPSRRAGDRDPAELAPPNATRSLDRVR